MHAGLTGTIAVSEAASAVGVSPGTVRLWESQGLVTPSRDGNGRRRYGPNDLDRLRRIKWWRTRALNAPAIKRLLDEDDYSQISNLKPVPPPPPRSNGAALRAMRKEAGLTLREVATASGLSTSFISAIERGISRMSPSAEARLLVALRGEEPVDSQQSSPIHTLGKGRAVRVAPGVSYEWLTAATGMLEPQYAVIGPGAGSVSTYQHDGEEFLLILDGHLEFSLGHDVTHVMGKDDSLHFNSQTPHSWRNDTAVETHVLWVTTERGVWGAPRRTNNTRGKGADSGPEYHGSNTVRGALT